MDPLSCHRFVAKRVRLQLFILAYNLGNFLRRLGLPRAIKDWSLRSLQLKLIKMGGPVVRHARQIIPQLAEVAVSRELFTAILGRLVLLRAPPVELYPRNRKVWREPGGICPFQVEELAQGLEAVPGMLRARL